MHQKNPYQSYRIAAAEAGLTIDEYLRQILQYAGRACQRLTRGKSGILLNRKPSFLQQKLSEADLLEIRLPQDTNYGVTPETGSVAVLYEDESLLVLNKPPFQLVHPAGQTTGKTLANYLAYYLQQNNTLCAIRPIHRLDRDTSGCVIFAKTAAAQTQLAAQLKTGQLKRCYSAVITGVIAPPNGIIDAPIAKDPQSPNRRIVHSRGMAAITHYRTLRRLPSATLLELTLDTGRTHQIRVHLAHLGHPIVGDKMYGKRSPLIARQALHAAHVTFFNLQTNQPVSVAAPLPEDIENLLRQHQ